MKIVRKEKPGETTFGDLDNGEVFRWAADDRGRLAMKCASSYVYLEDGAAWDAPESPSVIRVYLDNGEQWGEVEGCGEAGVIRVRGAFVEEA